MKLLKKYFLFFSLLITVSVAPIFAGRTCTMTVDPDNDSACKPILRYTATGSEIIGYACSIGDINDWGVHDCMIITEEDED